MNPCFVHSNESTQKFIWITLKSSPNIVLKSSRSHLWSIVNKRGTYLADSFFISNCSCKIEITVPCDIPVTSTSSRIFTRSVKTISWIIDDFWHSNLNWTSRTRCITCGCTFKFIYPIIYRKRCCRCAMNIPTLISFGIKPFICKCLITARNLFFFILQKKIVRFNRLQK